MRCKSPRDPRSATRRSGLQAATLGLAALMFAGCTTMTPADEGDLPPPIIFLHGNGDSATLWQSTLWRFESNGWPNRRLYTLDLPYPLARDEDNRPQAGRSSTDDYQQLLAREVDRVRSRTGVEQVILIGASRGGNTIRNYIQNGGGEGKVSHAILAGTPSHGIWSVAGLREQSEFSGLSTFLTSLNAPKTAAGDEVSPLLGWLTLRSDGNDKYAQPDGLWIGQRGLQTNITAASPELIGATNVVLPRADHRETATSAAAFTEMYRFLTQTEPPEAAILPEAEVQLSGRITGLGLNPTDPNSGGFPNNLPVGGARVAVYEIDPATGERVGEPLHDETVGGNGEWGPFTGTPLTRYEFEVSADGYPTHHVYRSPFPRSSSIVHFRLERPLANLERDAQALVLMSRPRGYFDARRDSMSFAGITPPPGVPAQGAGVSVSRLKATTAQPQPVAADFNGERVVGRTWPASENRVSILELTY